MHLKNAPVLITGAGSGVRPAVDELALRVRQPGTQAHGRTGDLTEPGAPKTVVASARAEFGGIDVVVDNPGTVRAGRLEAIGEPEGHGSGRAQPDGTDAAHRAALPSLREPDRGLVSNVSSGIALIAVPLYATDAATKAGTAYPPGQRCVVSGATRARARANRLPGCDQPPDGAAFEGRCRAGL